MITQKGSSPVRLLEETLNLQFYFEEQNIQAINLTFPRYFYHHFLTKKCHCVESANSYEFKMNIISQ